jgi:hypothetical protein
VAAGESSTRYAYYCTETHWYPVRHRGCMPIIAVKHSGGWWNIDMLCLLLHSHSLIASETFRLYYFYCSKTQWRLVKHRHAIPFTAKEPSAVFCNFRYYLTRYWNIWHLQSSVGIATVYGLGDPGSVPSSARYFSSPHRRGFGVHPAPYPMDTGAFSPGVKRPGVWRWPLISI